MADDSRRIDTSLSVVNIPKAPREDERPKYLPNWALKMRDEYEHKVTELQRKVDEYEMSIVQQDKANRHLSSQPSAMALYGGENAIQALMRQLALSPKFKDFTIAEQEYLALLGLGMGLNPEFHIHAWKNKKRVQNATTKKWETVEVLSVMVDYKALLFKAKSDRRVTIKDRKLTPVEMKARGTSDQEIEEGSISWVVEYTDLADAIMSKDGGIEYEPLRGYGFWAAKKDEEIWDDKQNKYVKTGKRIPNDVANGRDGAFMAWKRAVRALYYQIADMSLVFMSQPGMKQVDVVDDDIYQFVPDPEKTIEGEFSESSAAEEVKPSRWQDELGRKEKAAEWMASLGVTDEQYIEATGTNWRTYDISADEFKYAVELLAESSTVVEDAPEPVKPETPVTRAERSTEDEPENRDMKHETPPAAQEIELTHQPALMDNFPDYDVIGGPCKGCGDTTSRKDFIGDWFCEDCAIEAAEQAHSAS
ncbi:MAG: hypothetical protein WC455_19070 [Dehalococcoidia bacterium]|jgi:hypothetical protein